MSMPKGGISKKNWIPDAKREFLADDESPGKGEVPAAYEDYLILLQERNRLLKALQKKDEHEMELERKEQGFMLYVNGANHRAARRKRSSLGHASRESRTAGACSWQVMASQLSQLQTETERLRLRARTAPEKAVRRGWVAGSVNIKTARGDKLNVKAPDAISGKYEEDFESGESSEIDDECDSPAISLSPEKSPSQVTLSVADVSHLRQSLALNATLRQSLQHGETSDSDSGSDQIQYIPKEDTIESENSSPPSVAPVFKHSDLIVLEFESNSRSPRRLPSTPRKDTSLSVPHDHSPEPHDFQSKVIPTKPLKHKKQLNLAKPKTVIMKDSGVKACSLSANRKSGKTVPTDSNKEAAEVLATLRTENDIVEKRKGSRSAPLSTSKCESADSAMTSTSYMVTAVTTAQTSWKQRLAPTPLSLNHETSPNSTEELSPSGARKIDAIVSAVLALDSRGQRRLLRALAQIEGGMVSESAGSSSGRLDCLQTLNGAMESAKSEAAVVPEAVAPVEILSDEPLIEVTLTLEIVSSWGGAERVGLTEIQLYDWRGERLRMPPSAIQVSGASQQRGLVSALVNNHYKTIKDRNMWSTAFRRPGRSITITITGIMPALTKVKIWNYNTSVSELNMCAKRVVLRVQGRKVWEGDLDKGCANPVFDYGQVLRVAKSPKADKKAGKKHREPQEDAPSRAKMEDCLAIDTVSFHSDDNADSHVIRSGTRLAHRSAEVGLALPVIHAQEPLPGQVSETTCSSSSSQPSSGAPRNSEDRSSSATHAPSVIVSDSAARPDSGSQSENSIYPPDSGRESAKRRSRRSRIAAQQDGSASISPSDGSDNGGEITRSQSNVEVNSRGYHSSNSADSNGRRSASSERLKTAEENGIITSPRLGRRPSFHSSREMSPKMLQDDVKKPVFDKPIPRKSADRARPSIPPSPRSRKSTEKERNYQKSASNALDRYRLSTSDKECESYDKTKSQPGSLSAKEKSRDSTPHSSRGTAAQCRPSSKEHRQPSSSPPTDSVRKPDAPVFHPRKELMTGRALGEEKRVEKHIESECCDIMSQPRNFTSSQRDMKSESTMSALDTTLSDDDMPMLTKLRRAKGDTCEPSSGSHDRLPSWLKKEDADNAPFLVPADSVTGLQTHLASVERKGSDDLLENWSSAGVCHLATVLDEGSERQRNTSPHGRRSTTNTPDPLGESESGEVEGDLLALPRMKQIETNRAQWRQKQQTVLEESWTNLNFFERSQKGRISMDVQQDILDEYLPTADKVRPAEFPVVEEDMDSLSDEFSIPELPAGRQLLINIHTTWGDRHYVGLNGVEVFSSTGQPVVVTKIEASPADINVLPEYSGDPRVIDNVIDGVNRTRDDTHMWLAPFQKGHSHTITLTFEQPVSVALMRVWNYNKSRIHSFRGAKDITMHLDGVLIFKGEINRGCGGIMGGSEAFGDTILFTMDEDILEKVSQFDKTFVADVYADEEGEEEVERPATSDRGCEPCGRPFTSAAPATQPAEPALKHVAFLELNFRETWGDPYYLGLTALELAGPDGAVIHLTRHMLLADPPDLHVLPGYEEDSRTLDKLVNGVNITTADEHMWLIPYTAGEDHWLRITLPPNTAVSAIRVWNYNKSSEDTFRGARSVHVLLDGRQVSPDEGFLLRKGPGNCYFDFAQELMLTEPHTPRMPPSNCSDLTALRDSVSDEPTQEYELIQKPCGFIYQLHLLSTWGDPYYVGLNGIEIYDVHGRQVPLDANNISAYPDSINVLEGVDNDVRTPIKLIDGINDTADGTHMWLSPILPGILNRVYIIFDQPLEISMIKLWNYSKTSSRGVKDFALLVDDLLVYNGTLGCVSSGVRGILPTCEGSQPYHTVLFTQDKVLRQREKHTAILKEAGEQDVQLMNNRQIVAKFCDPLTSASGKPVDQSMRPPTSVAGHRVKRH